MMHKHHVSADNHPSLKCVLSMYMYATAKRHLSLRAAHSGSRCQEAEKGKSPCGAGAAGSQEEEELQGRLRAHRQVGGCQKRFGKAAAPEVSMQIELQLCTQSKTHQHECVKLYLPAE